MSLMSRESVLAGGGGGGGFAPKSKIHEIL